MLMLMPSKQNVRGPADGYVRMTFDMDESQRDRLKILSAMERRPMSELLREWVKAGMASLEKKHKLSK